MAPIDAQIGDHGRACALYLAGGPSIGLHCLHRARIPHLMSPYVSPAGHTYDASYIPAFPSLSCYVLSQLLSNVLRVVSSMHFDFIIQIFEPPMSLQTGMWRQWAGCLVKLRENRMIIIMLFNHPQFSIAESLPSFNMIALLLLAFITSLFDSLEN